MRKKIIITAFLLGITMAFSSCGSQKAQNDSAQTPSVVIAQNDYAGAFLRMTNIQTDVQEKMQILETHNYSIQEGNPDDYWADDNFFFLHFLPVYDEDLEITRVLNEIDAFPDIVTYITDVLTQAGYEGISIIQREKHHYRINYSGNFTDESTWSTKYGTMTLDCQYDPSKNRFLVEKQLQFSSSLLPAENTFFEFAELTKNTYALQNGKERMYVVYDDATKEISEFYYSYLPETEAVNISNSMDGYEKIEAINEFKFDGIVYPVPYNEDNLYVSFAEGTNVHFFTKDTGTGIFHPADISLDTLTDFSKSSTLGFYSKDEDSIYNHITEINADWVLQGHNFERTIVFKNHIMEIINTNPLTKEKTSFSVKETEVATESSEPSEE